VTLVTDFVETGGMIIDFTQPDADYKVLLLWLAGKWVPELGLWFNYTDFIMNYNGAYRKEYEIRPK
jgi:hypothetical protein